MSNLTSILPLTTTTITNNNKEKRPRFVPPGRGSELKVRWAQLKRRCGSGSLPEDSLGEPTNATESDGGGENSLKSKKKLSEKVNQLNSNSFTLAEQTGQVDEVVVENLQSPQYWLRTQIVTDGLGGETGIGGGGGGVGGSLGSPITTQMRTNNASEPESSLRNTHFEALGGTRNFLRWRVWPTIVYFFNPCYHDTTSEENYQKEIWYTSKSVVIFGACFLVFNWVLAISLLPHPWSLWNQIQNYGLGPSLALILVPMAALDLPRSKKFGWLWQITVWCSVWITASGPIIDMYLCGYFTPDRDCGNRDFISSLYAVSALPLVGLFSLGQTRIYTVAGIIVWISLVAGLILSDHVSFIRNMLNVMAFQGFILFTHYRRELSDRRMYSLRAELKVQFRAKQKAQINERKTMDSKRRFSSYIFHEVRVPLNTALLAVQNLEGANVFDKNSEQAVEYMALQGSLSMMSQVLNDVLDFSRMEKGGFSSVSRPFSFHKVMRSIFGTLKLDATARKLELHTNLDSRIDEVAKRAAFDEDELEKDVEVEEGEGLVMGDEMRLRQVINNLTSNACKFTSSGGQVSISTTLVYPTIPSLSELSNSKTSGSGSTDSTAVGNNNNLEDGSTTNYSPKLSTNNVLQHEAKINEFDGSHHSEQKVIVVRIEIRDTGVGIRPVDMAENRLFSPYIQTEIGRVQAGKGTGLGLSIVRQIVSLSGGRLGVKSQVGVGSVFWVEMPFSIGKITRQTDLEPHRRVNLTLEKIKILSTPDSYTESDFKFVPTSIQGHSEGIFRQIEEVEMLPVGTRRSSLIDEREVLILNPIPIPTSIQLPSPPPLTNNPPFLRPENRTNTSSSSVGILYSPASISSNKTLVFEKGPLKVLVVDDDSLTRRLMARMMSRLGCEVSTAENGAIALDMLLGKEGNESIGQVAVEKGDYDITFLDNQMPTCSGLQVVAKLRSLGRDDLVIGVTANALLSDQDEYLEKGATFVLTKPVLELDLRRFLNLADRKRMGFPLPPLN